MRMKLLSEETPLNSPTDVFNASLVRLHNTNTSLTELTQRSADGAVTATVTLAKGEIVSIEKNPTDTLEANGNVLAVKISYGSIYMEIDK
jgi:hypothetical protein